MANAQQISNNKLRKCTIVSIPVQWILNYSFFIPLTSGLSGIVRENRTAWIYWVDWSFIGNDTVPWINIQIILGILLIIHLFLRFAHWVMNETKSYVLWTIVPFVPKEVWLLCRYRTHFHSTGQINSCAGRSVTKTSLAFRVEPPREPHVFHAPFEIQKSPLSVNVLKHLLGVVKSVLITCFGRYQD